MHFIFRLMSGLTVSKGRDGRKVIVFSNKDLSLNVYETLLQLNLIICEKWVISPLPDLIEQTGLTLSEIKMIQAKASQKLCPRILQVTPSIEEGFDWSFGSRNLDVSFGCLLKEGKVLEIWGASGSGKTQLALQMCSAIPPEYCSAYISTEGSISTSRLFDICSARGMTSANCDMQTCTTVDSFSDCVLRQLPLLLATKPVKLVVIDSIAAPFRAGEVEGGGVRRAQKIRSIGQQLKYLSSEYKLLVVVLNQATDHPTKGTQPALGMTWSYLINSRLRIEKLGYDNMIGARRVSVDKGSCVKSGTFVDCTIQKEGLL